jgi:cytochrome c oxidase subunit IV
LPTNAIENLLAIHGCAKLAPPKLMQNHETAKSASYVHIVPMPVLLAVFAALLAFTVLTVAAARFDLGSWNLIVAMVIATVKASLVVLYFMHLRYDQPFNALIFIAALVFLSLFISLALLDTLQYQPDIQSWQQAHPTA